MFSSSSSSISFYQKERKKERERDEGGCHLVFVSFPASAAAMISFTQRKRDGGEEKGAPTTLLSCTVHLLTGKSRNALLDFFLFFLPILFAPSHALSRGDSPSHIENTSLSVLFKLILLFSYALKHTYNRKKPFTQTNTFRPRELKRSSSMHFICIASDRGGRREFRSSTSRMALSANTSRRRSLAADAGNQSYGRRIYDAPLHPLIFFSGKKNACIQYQRQSFNMDT